MFRVGDSVRFRDDLGATMNYDCIITKVFKNGQCKVAATHTRMGATVYKVHSTELICSKEAKEIFNT